MKKNYVYVVTSAENDHFAEMAAVSIKSLKLSNADAFVIVVMDEQTSTVRSPGVKLLKALSNSVIVYPAPYDTSLARSRYLKTSLINIINDRYVYLDSDTLILTSLDEIWDETVDIAATADLTPDDGNEKYTQTMKDVYQKMDWQFPPQRYLNSGVLLVNNTKAVQNFGQSLAVSWSEQYQKTAKVNDQYVFNHLLNMSDLKVKLLPVKLNAQFIMDPMVVRGAAVVHVFSGQFEARDDTVLHLVSKQLKRDGHLNVELLEQMIRTKNPWTHMDSVRKFIALKNYIGAICFTLKRFLDSR